ncbi:MAG: DUF192 domain-containing protein [Candidatus Liptonbacteria bacterium]|nr:DUF192 domain-containing protein [Candidatus Liptonbacteria bacterium]
MSRTFFVVILLIGLVGGAYYLIYGFPEIELAKVIVGERTFYVEIADTDEERTRGLAFRDKLESDGMLFLFETPGPYGFWMKDVRFPLDIIFIREGRVFSLERGVPVLQGNENPQTYYPAGYAEVTQVLELPAFSVDRYNIRLGTPVQIILPEERL